MRGTPNLSAIALTRASIRSAAASNSTSPPICLIVRLACVGPMAPQPIMPKRSFLLCVCLDNAVSSLRRLHAGDFHHPLLTERLLGREDDVCVLSDSWALATTPLSSRLCRASSHSRTTGVSPPPWPPGSRPSDGRCVLPSANVARDDRVLIERRARPPVPWTRSARPPPWVKAVIVKVAVISSAKSHRHHLVIDHVVVALPHAPPIGACPARASGAPQRL